MQKRQDDWSSLARALEQALKASKMDDMAISMGSGADYFAVRRMRLNGVINRSKNAIKLCSFFNLDDQKQFEQVDGDAAISLRTLVVDAWDGSQAHRQFLEDLLYLAGQYRVRPR